MSLRIERDMVLEGPLWPEPVRVLTVETFGTMVQVDSVGTRSRQFYPGIIVTEDQLGCLKVVSAAAGLDFSGDAATFHLAVEAHRIRLACEYDPHFAVNSSSITPLPHQLDAVYRYMLRSPLVRFLLADDPGAGKTIMAGLLLKELRFRGLADRVLIVVPPLVARQWQEELREKFSEEFDIIDSGVMRANVGRNPWTENDRCITSVYWAARQNVLEALREADWDLVIVDEAHKMAAYRTGKRVQKTRKTRLYRLGEELSLRTRHILLLTATPHKGDPENFRLLLELLDKDLFADRSILEDAMRSQDNPIILRRLKEEMVRFDGSPLFPPRTVKTVGFELTRIEQALYNEVTAYVADHFNKAIQKDKRNVGFAMTILQRRLASSIRAIRASLERRHARLSTLLEQVRALANSSSAAALGMDPDAELADHLGGAGVGELEELAEPDRWEVEESLVERLTNAESIAELEAEVAALERLVARARSVEGTGIESKFNRLLDAIIRDEGLASRGEKLLIFTEAKDTLDFLVGRLREQGFTVATIEGSLSMQRRREQQELFRGEAQIMVATEAGGESINLQFCNQMVNYDIPWNPNRLEQRMGRIHRIGQRNEVFIFNLVATDTREGMVLAALLHKMEEMRKGLGSDRVFDLVGELLDDHEISLSDLILDCVTHRRRLEDALSSIEQAVSPEHEASLLAAREEGLARQFVNLPMLRHEAASSAVRSLLPEHIARFFVGSLERHRGRWSRRADGGLRIERVPLDLRREKDLEFRRRHGTVQRAYPRLTFNKADVGEDGSAELLGPGHPLFESVLQAAESEFAAALARGATFFDPDIEAPERLWVFRGAVGDGTGRVLAKQLLLVREHADGTFSACAPTALHDLRPREEGDPQAAPIADFEAHKRAVTLFCLQELLPAFQREVGGERTWELEARQRYLERSFRVVISRHSDRLLQMRAREAQGEDMALAIAREQRLLEEATRRKEQRMEQTRRERQLVPRAPEYLGVAAVLPAGVAVGRAAPSPALLDELREREAARGRVVEDLRGALVGFDAMAHAEDGSDVCFLHVRAPDAEGRVWLRLSEWDHLRRLGSDAAVYVGDGQAITAHTTGLSPVVVERARRVALPLKGIQVPLAEWTSTRSRA